jgi:hypothetical protein
VGIFSIVMEANGYAPLRLTDDFNNLQLDPISEKSLLTNPTQPRYIIYSGEEHRKIRQTLINIFNCQVEKLPPKIAPILRKSGLLETRNMKGELARVFMITGAGAEGLSLKNVRTVHILEPYWNKVRTDQVKGRAVRICSHSDLPYDEDPAKNQRTVEIFSYLASFDEKLIQQRKIDQTLLIQDDGKTSDQHVYEVSNAKEKVSSDFLEAMREGAIDCALNQSENEGVQCYIQDGTINDFMYDPRLKEDIYKTKIEATNRPKVKAMPLAGPKAETAAPTVATAAPAAVKLVAFKTKDGREFVMETRGDKTYIFRQENIVRLRDRTLHDSVKPVGEIVKKDGKQVPAFYK